MRSQPLLMTFVALALLMLGACKDPCEKREKILDKECGWNPPAKQGDLPECEGEVEEIAQCSVDHPAEFCEFLDDLESENAYAECVGGIDP